MKTSPPPTRNAPPSGARAAYDPLNPEPLPPRRSPQEEPDKATKPRVNKWVTRALEWVILAVGIFLVLLMRREVLETAIVTSGSMEATLQINDRILVDHRKTLHHEWERGDIVFFETPDAWGGADDQLLVKRVIGLPGEKLELRNGVVYINDKQLNEPYLKEKPGPDFVAPHLIPEDEYWVMGDNRNNSDDSRENGPVPDDLIEGRGLRVLWPLGHAGALAKPDYGF